MYIEYGAVSGVFRTIDPPPPLPLAIVSSPRTKGGGYTLAGRCGGGGSIFWKTPDIGLASYIIPLRLKGDKSTAKPFGGRPTCFRNNKTYIRKRTVTAEKVKEDMQEEDFTESCLFLTELNS